MASQPNTPTSPSGLFLEPRSPNSWTARSFTTLRPSNSPSQIFFPKYSQASLLLAPKTDDIHTIKPQRKPAATQKQSQHSFARRNFRVITVAVGLQLALVVLTTMLVLIITAATSKPPKHIKPGYYIGAMLSSATGFASIVVFYMNCKERKKSESNRPPDEVNDPELALPPFTPMQRDFDELRAVVSNWESVAPPIRVRSIMTSRPQPSASARVAGSNNRVANARVRAFITENQGIEMQSLPAPQQPRPGSNTALELQRFLDHELQRQEAIKRRINSWLEDISATQESMIRPHRRDSLLRHPSPRQLQVPQLLSPPPQRRQTPRTSSCPAFPRIPPNPARLAEIDAEIEAYLGIPPPPLPIVSYPPSPSDPGKLALSLPPPRPPPPLPVPPRPSSTASIHASARERQQGAANGIDYSVLPPAIPRPGAKGRDPVLSDPITVVHIGPEDPAAKPSKPSSKLRDDDQSATSSDEGEEFEKSSKLGEVMEPGKATTEEVDDFAERWMERIRMGVEVETVVPDRKVKRGRGSLRWKFW
ncbi:MAG: hypothetical protein Q9201_005293 [Fulgogasparrea decipioides]